LSPSAAGRAALTLAALALVLASAALHAAWNTLVAGARDTHATTAIALLVGAAVFAVPAALTWRVDAEAWPYIAASAALELAYFALLAAVYTRADLSFAYPIARGSAPVLVLLISVIALGAAVSLVAAVGVLAVTGGVLLVRGVGRAAADAASLALALGVGACIAGYTLVDDHGVRHAAALPYFEVILVACALPYAAAIAARHGTTALRAAADWRAAAAGVGMVTAYLLVLAALERAEAAPVAALRETSVVMAAAGAAIAGREKVPPARLLGAVLVVAGVAALALG
jgi:drug/metabolite transporter (DMT)-like permease